MKILVTGNCGFIGQNFVRLFKDKYDLIGFDKLGYASDYKSSVLCKTYVGDLCDKEFLFKIVKEEKFDFIVNFAAESHVDNSITSPELFIYSNFVGTFNILEAARKYKVPKIVQIGTDEEMGDLQFDDPPFYDSDHIKPSSPYSASKAAASLLALSYNRTYNMNVVVTRSCNNYGPYQYKEKLLPVVISNALNDKKIPVYGDGKNVREWIFVEDNCYGVEAAMLNGAPGKVYFLGSGIEYDNLTLIKKILSVVGKSEGLISFVTDRKGHDLRYALDCEKTYTDLNWKPKTDIYNGLKITVDWIKDNKNYWE